MRQVFFCWKSTRNFFEALLPSFSTSVLFDVNTAWMDLLGNICYTSRHQGSTYHVCCGRLQATCLLNSYWLSRAPDSQPWCPRAYPTSLNCRKYCSWFRIIHRNLQHNMSSWLKWLSFAAKILLSLVWDLSPAGTASKRPTTFKLREFLTGP